MPYLPDAVRDSNHLNNLLRLAEAGYWIAFDSLLTREGVVDETMLTTAEVRRLIRNCVGADREFACCLCSGTFSGWGHNPDPLCTESGARCCKMCSEEKVIPQRIKDATREFAEKKTTSE